jgi:hypothetical protein
MKKWKNMTELYCPVMVAILTSVLIFCENPYQCMTEVTYGGAGAGLYQYKTFVPHEELSVTDRSAPPFLILSIRKMSVDGYRGNRDSSDGYFCSDFQCPSAHF